MDKRGIIASSCAAALLFLAGSVGTVEAQTKGSGQSATGGAGSSSGGNLVLYGSPGNCPPTIACGNGTPRRVFDRRSSCDQWDHRRTASGRWIRRCLDR